MRWVDNLEEQKSVTSTPQSIRRQRQVSVEEMASSALPFPQTRGQDFKCHDTITSIPPPVYFSKDGRDSSSNQAPPHSTSADMTFDPSLALHRYEILPNVDIL